jgi:pimeloyl-ACP methyl ester carboxylesterase
MKTLSKLLLLSALAGACSAQPRERTTPMTAATSSPTAKASETPAPISGYAEVNGIRYYYEISGRGTPLLLLHGGLGSHEMFGGNLAALAANHRVIAVDLQGHGRTALGDRPFSLDAIGKDMAGLLAAVGVAKADVIGYSMGAGVALRFALAHPQRVNRLVLASAPFSRDGWHPEMLPMQAAVGAHMVDMMKDTPMYQSYVAVAPKPEEFGRLLDTLGAQMREPYDWAEDVKRLEPTTLLVFGDADMVRLEHAVAFYKLIGGAQRDAGWQREHISKNRLAIIPDVTHYELGASPKLVSTIEPFLAGR